MFKMPSRSEIQVYAVMSLISTFFFVTIYGYTNKLAETAVTKYHFYFDWESAIPLVPGMILVYMSLNILTLMPLFTLNKEELLKLGYSFILTTFIAGFIFYFFPAPVIFSRLSDLGFWSPFYNFIYSLDHVNNSLPSLHIAYSFLTVRSIYHSKNGKIFWLWFALICLSVLLTHQHHVLDIAAGIAVAEFVYRLIFCRKIL